MARYKFKNIFFLLVFNGGLFLLSSSLWGQLPQKYTEPVPLDAGGLGTVQPNANNIIFFQHLAIPSSSLNFKESPSHVSYGNGLAVDAEDLLGTPGFPVTSSKKLEQIYVQAMLADPAGLCFENFLINVVCSPEGLSSPPLNKPSWELLITDLRNYVPNELKIPNLDSEIQNVTLSGDPILGAPYDSFGLASIVSNSSPPGICYDVASAEDWIACPVFGRITIFALITSPSLYTGMRAIEIQSPVIIYRRMEDGLYHLAGYLANPTQEDYTFYDVGDSTPQLRNGNVWFPLSIAAGNFSDAGGALGKADIAVMGTATQPHSICRNFNDHLVAEGLGAMPWGLDCTYGMTWIRVLSDWAAPRETFDSLQILVGAPKIYDMATGQDTKTNATILFAPSNAPAQNKKFYVLKYYEAGFPTISSSFFPASTVVPPRLIEVTPPQEGSGPFKIAAWDINGDGYSDFALTWKDVTDVLANTEHHIWKGKYSPFVSVFISRVSAGQIVYDQFDYTVPLPNSSETNLRAQLAAVAFGRVQGQPYLIVGDNKRISLDGNGFHAFNYLFPISGGVVDNLNVKAVKASSKQGNADTPGVGDIAPPADNSGVIASALRDPFIPAPESCNVPDGGAYGFLWLGEKRISTTERIDTLDSDHDGIPNRCECVSLGLHPDESNDSDGDELVDDPACDSCPGHFNEDLEHNSSGVLVGDGIADACDNCPPARCTQYDGFLNAEACINPNQMDSDGDGVGNSCDSCPAKAGLTSAWVYVYGTIGGDPLIYFSGTPQSCSYCSNGYATPGGVYVPINLGVTCDMPISAPGAYGPPGSAEDLDGDGVPNERDNCVYVYNPPPASSIGSSIILSGDHPSGQADSDGDGSGDACDCPNAGRWDDCDGDGIPNRFDHSPAMILTPLIHSELKLPDSVYDPYAGYIADGRDLKLADTATIEISPLKVYVAPSEPAAGTVELVSPTWIPVYPAPTPPPPSSPAMVCDYPASSYPGPVPCDEMGTSSREVTVVLPSQTSVAPAGPTPPCVPGVDAACTPSVPPTQVPGGTPPPPRAVSQFCIAKVGRSDANTAAIFKPDQDRIIAANNRIQEITGIKDFDILVGSDGAIVHWECVFIAGAYPTVAQATGVLPDVQGNVAPFMLAQLSGLPPIPYERRPDASLSIQSPQALLLAPLNQGGGPALTPNLNIVLPNRELRSLAPSGVQFGTLRENINGNMVFKVLDASSNLEQEKTSLGVTEMQSLIVVDYKTYPEPSSGKPIEQRAYNIDNLVKTLEDRVNDWKQRGKPITIEIYRDLPWEELMHPEFVVAQSTVPEAVASINASLSAQGVSASASLDIGSGQLAGLIPEDHINSVVLPAYIATTEMAVSGGGCGCRFATADISWMGIFYLFCLFTPVPVLLYYRQKRRKGG